MKFRTLVEGATTAAVLLYQYAAFDTTSHTKLDFFEVLFWYRMVWREETLSEASLRSLSS